MPYNKFNVSSKERRTVFALTFDSLKERDRYLVLKSKEQAGEISALEMQIPFILQPDFKYGGKKERPIKFTIDFRYFDNKIGCVVYEEVKGMRTRDYILRRKMFLYQNPDKVFIET